MIGAFSLGTLFGWIIATSAMSAAARAPSIVRALRVSAAIILEAAAIFAICWFMLGAKGLIAALAGSVLAGMVAIGCWREWQRIRAMRTSIFH